MHCNNICISFIVKSVIECFAMIYTLVFNDALKKTSACMSRRSLELIWGHYAYHQIALHLRIPYHPFYI